VSRGSIASTSSATSSGPRSKSSPSKVLLPPPVAAVIAIAPSDVAMAPAWSASYPRSSAAVKSTESSTTRHHEGSVGSDGAHCRRLASLLR
jgi:hypothetical protein